MYSRKRSASRSASVRCCDSVGVDGVSGTEGLRGCPGSAGTVACAVIGAVVRLRRCGRKRAAGRAYGVSGWILGGEAGGGGVRRDTCLDATRTAGARSVREAMVGGVEN